MSAGDDDTPTKIWSAQVRRVEDILQRWHEWDVPWCSPPTVVRELTGGSTNQSYLITADNKQWALRLNADNAATIGVDRTCEAQIIERAAAAKIAPPVVYCSVESGVLISEFIEGRHWKATTLDDSEHLRQLLDLVRAVHNLAVEAPAIDYFAHAEHYWATLDAAEVKIPLTLHHEREILLEQRGSHPLNRHSTHLCHHDLSPSNVIDHNGRLYLLDWEYAARGSRTFDYACLATEWNIPLKRLQEHANIDLAKVSDAVRLYRYICRLWELLNQPR